MAGRSSPTDPWTISQKMIDAMNDQAMQEQRLGATSLQNAFGAQATRQNYAINNQYDVEAADTKYGRDKNMEVLRSNLDIREERDKAGATPRRPGFSGPATSSNTPMPNAGGEGFEKQAYTYYRSKGLSHAHAAGIAGNLAVESGGDPRVLAGVRRGDAGSAAYAAQWRGSRLAGLEDFARKRGNQKPTTQDQLDYVLEEGNPQSPYYEPGAGRAHQLASQARDPAEAAASFMTEYERPNKDPNINHISRRQQIAMSLADDGASTDATTTASVQQPTVSPATQPSQPPFPTPQRRQSSGPLTGDPDVDRYAPEMVDPATTTPIAGGYSMTPEEVDALLDDHTRNIVRSMPGKIPVDIGTYSAEQLQLVLGTVGAQNIIPLYGTDPKSGKSQYLILADDPNYAPGANAEQTGPVPYDPTAPRPAQAPQVVSAPSPEYQPPAPAAQQPFDPASTQRRYTPMHKPVPANTTPGRDGDVKVMDGIEYVYSNGKWIPTE